MRVASGQTGSEARERMAASILVQEAFCFRVRSSPPLAVAGLHECMSHARPFASSQQTFDSVVCVCTQAIHCTYQGQLAEVLRTARSGAAAGQERAERPTPPLRVAALCDWARLQQEQNDQQPTTTQSSKASLSASQKRPA